MRPIVTFGILAITSFVSLLEVPLPGIAGALAINPAAILYKPWMLLTAIFVHVNLGHLLQNMMALAIFGTFLEKVIGKWRWLAVYFASGIAGNIAGLLFYPNSMSLGASGAIMGLTGALTLLRPKASVWFGAELPVIFLSAIFIISDVAGLLAPSDIGNAAHLGGFLAGAAFGRMWQKKFSEKKESRAKVRQALKAY